jgi:uncharacterized protein
MDPEAKRGKGTGGTQGLSQAAETRYTMVMDQTRRGLLIGMLSCVCASLLAVEIAFQSTAAAQSSAFPVSQLTVETARGRFAFTVEVADTGTRRVLGLQGRRTLEPNAGMLFDFQTPQMVSMWMKDTYLPLDMIFVAADGVILNIAEKTVPHSLIPIVSTGKALAVLEVNAGTARRLGIRPGDRVFHSIFDGAGG